MAQLPYHYVVKLRVFPSSCIVQQRSQTLEQRLKQLTTGISNIHVWLNNRDLDSLMQANAMKNYCAAEQLFRQIHRAGLLTEHVAL